MIPYEDMMKENVSRKFLRDLGNALNTVVFFDTDEEGNNRIEPYYPDSAGTNSQRARRQVIVADIIAWYVIIFLQSKKQKQNKKKS